MACEQVSTQQVKLTFDLLLEMFGHDEGRDGGVEGVFGAGGPLEHPLGLRGEALMHQGVPGGPATLVDRAGAWPELSLAGIVNPPRVTAEDAPRALCDAVTAKAGRQRCGGASAASTH